MQERTLTQLSEKLKKATIHLDKVCLEYIKNNHADFKYFLELMHQLVEGQKHHPDKTSPEAQALRIGLLTLHARYYHFKLERYTEANFPTKNIFDKMLQNARDTFQYLTKMLKRKSNVQIDPGVLADLYFSYQIISKYTNNPKPYLALIQKASEICPIRNIIDIHLLNASLSETFCPERAQYFKLICEHVYNKTKKASKLYFDNTLDCVSIQNYLLTLNKQESPDSNEQFTQYILFTQNQIHLHIIPAINILEAESKNAYKFASRLICYGQELTRIYDYLALHFEILRNWVFTHEGLTLEDFDLIQKDLNQTCPLLLKLNNLCDVYKSFSNLTNRSFKPSLYWSENDIHITLDRAKTLGKCLLHELNQSPGHIENDAGSRENSLKSSDNISQNPSMEEDEIDQMFFEIFNSVERDKVIYCDLEEIINIAETDLDLKFTEIENKMIAYNNPDKYQEMREQLKKLCTNVFQLCLYYQEYLTYIHDNQEEFSKKPEFNHTTLHAFYSLEGTLKRLHAILDFNELFEPPLPNFSVKICKSRSSIDIYNVDGMDYRFFINTSAANHPANANSKHFKFSIFESSHEKFAPQQTHNKQVLSIRI